MARGRKPPRAGPQYPFDTTAVRLTGIAHTRMTKFGLKVRRWPAKRPGKPTPAQQAARDDFTMMVRIVQSAPSWDRGAAQALAHDTGWTWRDVLSACATGTFWEDDGLQSSAVPFILDVLSNIEGSILYRGPDGWVGLAPAANGDVLTLTAGEPGWTDPSLLPTGIHQLTGDVAAGPGTGSQVATLAASGVAAGSYHHATVMVDAKGRLTAAVNGAVATSLAVGLVKPDGTTITVDGTGTLHGAASAINQLTGDVVAGPGSGSQAATLSATGVAAGSYHHATITVDAKGRLSVAGNGAVATGAAVGLVKPDNTTLSVTGDGTLVVGGGGGGGIGGLYSGVMSPRPTSANTGLNTWLNQGTATVNDNAAGVTIVAPFVGSDSMRCRRMAAPVAPYNIDALIINNCWIAGNGLSGIGWYDGTNKIHAVDMNHLGLEVTKWNSPTSFSGADLPLAGGTFEKLWVRLSDDGTTITFNFSYDAVNWWILYQHAKSTAWLGATGYSNIVFFANPNGNNVYATLASFKVN